MVIISLSVFHQKLWFDRVFPIEIPLFHEKALFHFKLSRAYFEGFFESCAPDVVPAGAFWEVENWLFGFFKPFVPGVVPAGAFWELKTCVSEFSSPLFQVSFPQGLFCSSKIDFPIFCWPCKPCAPNIVPPDVVLPNNRGTPPNGILSISGKNLQSYQYL